MTSESKKFRFSKKKSFLRKFFKKWYFLKRHKFFSGIFRDKRFFELDAEKAEFFENQGFVGLLCVALCEIIPFL